MGVVDPLAGGDGLSIDMEGNGVVAVGVVSDCASGVVMLDVVDGDVVVDERSDGPRMGDCMDEIDADDIVPLRMLSREQLINELKSEHRSALLTGRQ